MILSSVNLRLLTISARSAFFALAIKSFDWLIVCRFKVAVSVMVLTPVVKYECENVVIVNMIALKKSLSIYRYEKIEQRGYK